MLEMTSTGYGKGMEHHHTRSGDLTTSRNTEDYIVVPEGLAIATASGANGCLLSDYYEAVLQRVVRETPVGARVFLAPGNSFGLKSFEEECAACYMAEARTDLTIFSPEFTAAKHYVDTLDNALLLRRWLEDKELWPLGEAALYCNAPHRFRSALLFRLCGFRIKRVVGCRPDKVTRNIVPRLWFYNYPPLQAIYECGTLLCQLGKWSYLKAREGGKLS